VAEAKRAVAAEVGEGASAEGAMAEWGHGAWERARDRILRILANGYPGFKLDNGGGYPTSLLPGDAVHNGRWVSALERIRRSKGRGLAAKTLYGILIADVAVADMEVKPALDDLERYLLGQVITITRTTVNTENVAAICITMQMH
jgi:hypothetical protein